MFFRKLIRRYVWFAGTPRYSFPITVRAGSRSQPFSAGGMGTYVAVPGLAEKEFRYDWHEMRNRGDRRQEKPSTPWLRKRPAVKGPTARPPRISRRFVVRMTIPP